MMIESAKLLLRPILVEDNEEVFQYRSDAEANKFQGSVPTRLDEIDELISKNPSEFNEPDTWYQLVIVKKATGEIIGDIGVHFLGKDGFQCELGITLSRHHQGKGYATLAMKMTMEYLFNTLHKHRIICSVDPENTGSIRLLERLQFRKEAYFRQGLFLHGRWVDDVIYAILKSEWNS